MSAFDESDIHERDLNEYVKIKKHVLISESNIIWQSGMTVGFILGIIVGSGFTWWMLS